MEAAEAAQLPTAHISHLHRARWFHTGGPRSVYGKRHDSPLKCGYIFCFRTYSCMCTCGPNARSLCQDPSDLNSHSLCTGDAMRNTFFPLYRQTKTHCLTLRQTVGFIWSPFDRLACVTINSNGPPRRFLEKQQNKTEGSRAGRPVTGGVRDGDGETALSEVLLSWALAQEREKRDAQSRRAALASVSKEFSPVTALTAQ